MSESNGFVQAASPYVDDTTTKTEVLSPAIVPEGEKISEEDRLFVENIYLKIQNAAQTMQLLDVEKAKLDDKKNQYIDLIRRLQKEMDVKRTALSEKYGMAISRDTVGADGTIKRPQ